MNFFMKLKCTRWMALWGMSLVLSAPASFGNEVYPGIFQNLDPSQGPVEQAMGFYSSGSLVNATRLPDSGDGFVKLFPNRDRGWGTYDLQYVLALTSSKLKETNPKAERIQIGDMAGKNGGFIGRHASHQNGLDVDVAFLKKSGKETDPDHNGFDEVFVRDGKLTPNFDLERNWELVNHLMETGRVQRIFVDQVIKLAFCEYTQLMGTRTRSTEVLRALRAWPHHADHLHVRLDCPDKSPSCTAQAAPPEGDGCEEALKPMHWFTVTPFSGEPGIEE